jgi:hypothetical protein
MPYTIERVSNECTVCGSVANIHRREFGVGTVVDCARCGDFSVPHEVAKDLQLPFTDPKKRALASYTIRRMQASGPRPKLTADFFASLKIENLPTPAEVTDNLINWLADKAEGMPGALIELAYSDLFLLGAIGVVGANDIAWAVNALKSQDMFDGSAGPSSCKGNLTVRGWQRFEELKRAHIASRFAFFARKFDNAELDIVYEKCLRPAVRATGYELRTVTQRAGLVDALIEDEIRRCRFLVADLSDDNAGAYWEAGFAEGLGKPVIYVCRARDGGAEKRTHFDANHRHTIRWDSASLDQTAANLKAVIRNTLLGDAKQADEAG